VIWHLVGVMVAPISVPPQMNRGDSVLGAELKKAYGPYITATFLDHSYKFFAPNPGASHLVRYDLYFADGTSRVNRDDQVFPNRLEHWPRLLYHRHFMLTEFMNFPPIWEFGAPPPGTPAGAASAAGTAPGAPPEVATSTPIVRPIPGGEAEPIGPLAPPAPADRATPGQGVPVADFLERFHREGDPGFGPRGAGGEVDRGPLPFVVHYWRAAAEYLAKRHGAVRVDLYLREHRLPFVDEYLRDRRLDMPASYVERLLVSYRTSDPTISSTGAAP
jgi:hypothetical protein